MEVLTHSNQLIWSLTSRVLGSNTPKSFTNGRRWQVLDNKMAT